ncbi:hypothetical protein Bbelb_124390 [Branchiostoma belcheri]|nr:hypothetical protein Bbelb_124390 [Branchiostoma belcheri]
MHFGVKFSLDLATDKPARPAEMPETDPDAHRWKQISQEVDDRDLHHPVTAFTSFPILEEVGCAGLMAFQHEASLLRRQLSKRYRAFYIAGYFAHRAPPEGRRWHCSTPWDKPARPAEMPETDPDAHRWKQISQEVDDRDLHHPVTAFTSSLSWRRLDVQGRPLKAEDGTAALHGFWLNLNWKDGLDCGLDFGAHCFLPDDS